MLGVSLKKEFLYFFKNVGNLIFVFVLPFLFILLMSTALKDYVANDFDTFDNGAVFYYLDRPTEQSMAHLHRFQEVLAEAAQVKLEEVGDYDEGKRKVEQSEAFGIIKIHESSFSYYRSPFNEPEGGRIVRSLFEATIGKAIPSGDAGISTQVIARPKMDSNAYFTLTGLAFFMMFISLMISNSVIDERRFGTIERIKLSQLGLNAMLISKAALGVCIGLLQAVTVYALSSSVLGVNWGSMTGWMFLVLTGMSIACSVFGAVVGMIAKSKAVANSVVLMSVMLSAYLGGAFSPVYLLENMNVVNYMIQISPLYWAGKSLGSLHAGMLDRNSYLFLSLQLGLVVLFYLLYRILGRRAKLVIEGG